MADLCSLLNQMSSVFNETKKTDSINLNDDKTVKWKSLINNSFAKKEGKDGKKPKGKSFLKLTRKSRSKSQQEPDDDDTTESSADLDTKETKEPTSPSEIIKVKAEPVNLKIESTAPSDFEEQIDLINRQPPQLVDVLVAETSDKPQQCVGDIGAMSGSLSVLDDKKSATSVIEPTASVPVVVRSLRSKASVPNATKMAGDDVEPSTSENGDASVPKKGRGRPRLDEAITTKSKDLKGTVQEKEEMEASKDGEGDEKLKRGGRRSKKVPDEEDQQKIEDDKDVEMKIDTDEQQKRRGRSRKMQEEPGSSNKCQQDESMDGSVKDVQKLDKIDKMEKSESSQMEVDDQPKRKRGRSKKSNEPSEAGDDDMEKPRLIMTIRTDKIIPKIINPANEEPEQETKLFKKRGRRPKLAAIVKPLQAQTKKSPRLTKDSILASAIARREKINQQLPPPALPGRERSLRRIKPTAKILANDELRQGFEYQNCVRLSISSDNMDHSPNKSLPEELKPIEIEPKKVSPKSSPPRKASNIVPILENIFPIAKPCKDPQQFLQEIKIANLGTNKSPEDNKKLNKKQQRRLFKLKEKHFSMLGLRRTSKPNEDESSTEESDIEEFIPKNRIDVGKPGITLRLRNQKMSSPAPIAKRNPKKRKEQQHKMPALKKINLSVEPQKYPSSQDISDDDCLIIDEHLYNETPTITNGNKENQVQDTLICLCQQKTKFFVKHQQKLAESSDGRVYCHAIDEIENKLVGCNNEITEPLINLLRPSAKVSYTILCTSHKKRLIRHNCCAGCGVFLTQGDFAVCPNKHFFHRDCAIKYIMTTPYEPNNPHYAGPSLVLKCPHCQIDAPTFDFRVTMKCENFPVFMEHRLPKPAKMSVTGARSQPSNSLQANFEKLIPDGVVLLLRNAVAKLRAKEMLPSSSSAVRTFTTKDFFFAIQAPKDEGDERVADIIASGFNLLTPFKELNNGTCLHLVANFGTLNMAYLILCRANSQDFVDVMDKQLRTATMCAVAGGKTDIIKLLVQCGCDVTIKGLDGMTALHLAAKIGNYTIVQIILEHFRQIASVSQFEKFINSTDAGHWTPLVWAAENGHNEVVSYLLSLGADANICDGENNTVVHWAALSGRLQVIFPLIKHCDINIQNVHGDTALHIASREANTKICLLLLSNGANLSVKNLNGELPFDCVPDKNGQCAKLIQLNLDLRKIGIGGVSKVPDKIVLYNDLSNGRELYPIQLLKSQAHHDEETILPDFKYITKNILLQNTIQIDQRVSNMRICDCSDNCISDNCHCGQVSLQIFYNVDGRLIDNFNYEDPPMLFECNDVCGCNKLLCKNRVVQNGSRSRLAVFECDDKVKGFGVRCLNKILRGSFVAQYCGEILMDQEADRRTNDSYFFDLGASDHCIDANFYGNVSRFFNHSCNPNIVAVRVYFDHQDLRFPKIAFFALRDIEAGEEISFDYGVKFWMIKCKFFTCWCRSPKCRFSSETIDKTVDDYNQRNAN